MEPHRRRAAVGGLCRSHCSRINDRTRSNHNVKVGNFHTSQNACAGFIVFELPDFSRNYFKAVMKSLTPGARPPDSGKFSNLCAPDFPHWEDQDEEAGRCEFSNSGTPEWCLAPRRSLTCQQY